MIRNLCSFNFVKVDQSESPLTPMSGRLFFPNMATSKSLAFMNNCVGDLLLFGRPSGNINLHSPAKFQGWDLVPLNLALT